jgi:hypothetical protein
MTETHNIIAALARVAKKLAGNKNVGQLCIWVEDPVNQSNKLNHQFYKRQETAKMTKRTTDIMVAVVIAAYIKKALAKSLAIFKPMRPGLLFQTGFCLWSTHKVHITTLSKSPWWRNN